VSRPMYTVTAQRDGRWWFVRVPEVPGAVTQARRLDQVEAMAREVVSLLLEVAPDSFDLDVRAAIPDEVRAELAHARDLQRQAERTQAEAATLVRDRRAGGMPSWVVQAKTACQRPRSAMMRHAASSSEPALAAWRRAATRSSRRATHTPIDDKGWRAMDTGSAARSAADSGWSRPAS
jgi:predicted RNase H-like HicB family nuclease